MFWNKKHSKDQDLQLVAVQFVHRHGHRTPVHHPPAPFIPQHWPLCQSTLQTQQHDWLLAREHSQHPNSPSMPQHPLSEQKGEQEFILQLEDHSQSSAPLFPGSTLGKGNCYMGQLTDKGKQTMKALGERLRQLYVEKIGFLAPEFREEEISVRTTDYTRTIESVQSLLKGLFPENGNSSTNSNSSQRQQMIPISIRLEKDETMYQDSQCSKAKSLYSAFLAQWNLQRSATMKELQQKYAAFAGKKDPSLPRTYDFLTSYYGHGYKIDGITQDHIAELEKVVFERDYGHFFDPNVGKEALKLCIGRFVGEMAEFFQGKVHNTANEEKKMKIYSGHDGTLVPLLAAFKMLPSEGEWPPYASNVTFELWKDPKEEKHWVRSKYQEKAVSLPECSLHTKAGDSTLCDARKWFEIAMSVVPTDYSRECSIDKEK